MQVVRAAHMNRADEDLRHGIAAVGALDHRAALLGVAGHIDLVECDPLARQQGLGCDAIGAVAGSVDVNLRHRGLAANSFDFVVLYMGGRAAATTRANTSTSTFAAPARLSARAQASTVAPVVITSS